MREALEKIAAEKLCDDPGESKHCTLNSGPYCGSHQVFNDTAVQIARAALAARKEQRQP